VIAEEIRTRYRRLPVVYVVDYVGLVGLAVELPVDHGECQSVFADLQRRECQSPTMSARRKYLLSTILSCISQS